MDLNEVDKKNKIFRLANIIFSTILFCLTLGYCIYTITIKDFKEMTRLFSPMFMYWLVYILEFIFRKKVSNFVLTFFNVYVFFASFLGTVCNFYGIFGHFDDVMHTLFGYVGCIGGVYMLTKLADYKHMSNFFIMLSCMFVAMGCAALWEVSEYFCDTFFGATSQGGLDDTMMDIIDSLFGVIVFEINFIVHRKSNKKLLIGSVVEDFLNN